MFEIFVKRAGDLTADENAQLDEASNLAFAGSGAEDLCWSNSDWFILGKVDGRVTSVVGIVYREVRVGDAMVLVGGIGGVSTHPDYQRQGYAGKLMQRAGAFMQNEEKAPFGLLVCDPIRVPYYAGFGWQPMEAPMYFSCRGEHRLYKGPIMILPLSGEAWPGGDVDLLGGPW